MVATRLLAWHPMFPIDPATPECEGSVRYLSCLEPSRSIALVSQPRSYPTVIFLFRRGQNDYPSPS